MPTIHDILRHPVAGETICVHAWLRTRRDSKSGLSFLNVYDGSCVQDLQIVAFEHLQNYHSEIKHLSSGSALRVLGDLVPSQGTQAFEVHATSIELLGDVDDPERYPIQPKAHTAEFLRSVAHLRPRTQLIGAVMRLRHGLSRAIHQFFDQQGFFWIHTPIITSSDCEGAGDLFQVTNLNWEQAPRDAAGKLDFSADFFGRKAYLGVSGQLYLEAYCQALSKVYSFGPTFRAENSNTSRHLAEFWMVEAELAFADLADNARLAEQMLQAVCKDVLERHAEELAFFEQHLAAGLLQRVQDLSEQSFTRLDYSDAIDILKKSGKDFEYEVHWGVDLQSEHERFLAEEYCHGAVILMNYPKEIKSFYMRLNDDQRTVAAMDVLVPGMGEIIGGAQREERYEALLKRMNELHMQRENYEWYLDLRRYGSVRHAGFGLGLERLLSYISGLNNVRDVIPFPRTPKHADF